jgi:ferrochelatase
MTSALLVVSFGGPEKTEDVLPFLEHVLKGRGVPHERMLEVAEHYYHFGGKSPINDQCRALIEALGEKLSGTDLDMPIYWGNRHAAPFLDEAFEKMAADGITKAYVFVTSAYSSYSGCRQYREAIESVRTKYVHAPEVVILRRSFDHPLFADAWTSRVSDALSELAESDRNAARLVFTAHSIPSSMSAECDYVAQLNVVSKLVAERCGFSSFDFAFQSRSGPPQVPWLGPDIGDHVRAIAADGVKHAVVVPIGFLSDHMEVVWDLDEVARGIASEVGIGYVRAKTVGTHPLFVEEIVDLVREASRELPRRTLNVLPLRPEPCAANCCPAPARR